MIFREAFRYHDKDDFFQGPEIDIDPLMIGMIAGVGYPTTDPVTEVTPKHGSKFWLYHDFYYVAKMFNWYPYDNIDQVRSIVCTHHFPDTGCLRSFCSYCDATAQFNWITGKYEEVRK